jgi:hypothetical protein
VFVLLLFFMAARFSNTAIWRCRGRLGPRHAAIRNSGVTEMAVTASGRGRMGLLLAIEMQKLFA